MSYDPQELTALDVIRGMAGDTGTTEWLSDDTYNAVLARHAVSATAWDTSPAFLRAAAELLRRVAVAIESKPTSFTATGDMSVSWSDRTRTLRALADQLEAQAKDMDGDVGFFGGVTTVTNRFMTDRRAVDEW